ncbi:interleukin-21 [Pyrgilauda ruficollis]|uniref:interleukin-21 n=1 Tax=Pyrgilauda ruficollis TaxID=221976 RepID=UPI001B867068|nr:interleukin-21 [Pyrgilauda ruficollis]
MKRMIIFCMLFFCSTMMLTAASPRTVKYKQILNKIGVLKRLVKDKDAELLHTPENFVEGCLSTAVTCFKSGTLKLQPASNQDKGAFTKAIRTVQNFTYRNSGKNCELYEKTCESYEKKTPKEFLKGFENLMQMLYKNECRTHQS